MTTRRDLVRRIGAPLEPLYGPAEARQIALLVLSARTGIAPAALLADPGAPLDLPEADTLAKELAAGRPVQYVLGFTEFCGLHIGVREGVLIPRPETEELVAWIATENPAARRLLDIGTGSGCIALALKHLLPAATVCGADLSSEALAIARTNAAALGLRIALRRADALQADTPDADPAWLHAQSAGTPGPTLRPASKRPCIQELPAPADNVPHTPHAPATSTTPPRRKQFPTELQNGPIGSQTDLSAAAPLSGTLPAEAPAPALSQVFPGPFDVMVSNPPYIPASERAGMRSNVTHYEPARALFVPDDDPLCFYRAIVCTARRLLAPKGTLYFEIHEQQGDAIARLLAAAGFTDVELRHDFRGKPRMIRARKPTAS